ncbi:CRISPR-associated protein Csm6 [Clostridiales bacterium COT073_COT-073]|nr:CRISPR-associated protein Csm6 [Clostridiales bacterium COT073_COT-073]
MSIILFSPLGNHDPIATANLKDGSMLHITRVFKPDKIILYMSKSILENHKKDNRFLYCLDKLAEMQNRKIDVEIIERPELEEVQKFEYFVDDFTEEIRKIREQMQPEDTLLLNISSGTPAMKSALFMIQHLGEYNFEPIQVKTPTKGSNNYSVEQVYPLEEVWELNEDNKPDFENRCSVETSSSLLKLKNQEIIKKFIASYDYHSAYVVAEKMGDQARGYIKLLEIAGERLQFKFPEVNKGLKEANLTKEERAAFLPQENSEIRKYFEYALLLGLKKKKKEYADFIRAISPLIFDLFVKILKEQFKIDISLYTTVDKKNQRWWSEEKLNSDETGQQIMGILDKESKDSRKRDFDFSTTLQSEHIKMLILSGDLMINMLEKVGLKETVEVLRDVEYTVRNLAAHQMIMITDEIIKNKTEYSSEQIMNYLKKAFIYAGMNIKKEDWESYDRMNEVIISKMG